jgi:hypothetical protein
MACELIEYCQFFHDNMKDMPKAAEHIKSRLCLGDYQHCNRFRMFKQTGGVDIQCEPNPSDAEEVEKIIQRLRAQRLSEEQSDGKD